MSHLWINCEFLFLVAFSIWHLSQPLNKFSKTTNSKHNKACSKCLFICLLSCSYKFILISLSNWIFNSSQHGWYIFKIETPANTFLHSCSNLVLSPAAYPLRHCSHCLDGEPLIITLQHNTFPDHVCLHRYNSTSVFKWNSFSCRPYKVVISRNTEELMWTKMRHKLRSLLNELTENIVSLLWRPVLSCPAIRACIYIYSILPFRKRRLSLIHICFS